MSDDENMAQPWAWPVTLEAVRGWLRLGEQQGEDRLLTDLIAAATGLCEAFIGQAIYVRGAEWRGQMVAGGLAMALPLRPFVALDEVARLDGEDELPLGAESYALMVEADGCAKLRLKAGFGVWPMVVRYRAGMAAAPEMVPEALRHGILRMVLHLYETRDGTSGAGAMGPPAAVAALWQPWRPVTLGGRR